MSATHSSRINYRILLVGLLLLLPFILLMVHSFGRDPREVPSVLVHRPAPNFELESLDGERIRLDELRGRWVVLNFWSTWCQPCKIEHPLLLRAGSLWPDAVFLGVLYGDTPEKARTYLSRAGSAYPHLVDSNGAVAIDYGVAGVPETFFIGPDGSIHHKQVGPVTPEILSTYLGEATR